MKITPVPYPTSARSIFLGISLALALLCAQAQAHTVVKNFAYDNCELSNSTDVNINVAAAFKKTSERGDFLSEWEDIHHYPGWSCTRYGHVNGKANVTALISGIELNAMPDVLAADFVADDGKTYSVYKADPAGQIGYIMRRQLIITQGGNIPQLHDMLPVTLGNQSKWTNRFNIKQDNQERYQAALANQVRLLKWGQGAAFPGSGVSFQFRAATFRYRSDIDVNIDKHTVLPKGYPLPQSMSERAQRRSWVNVRLERSDKTCRTTSSDQTVRLPTIGKDHFLKGKDSTAGKTAFVLELGNCDADINHIDYTLLPAANGSAENGILPSSPKSTATGVNIQILDADENPVQLGADVKHLVKGYQPGAVSARIPLYAQYIQTASQVTVGNVLASMIVTYTYK